MHPFVFYFSFGWITILLGATLALVIRRSQMFRILALDTLTLHLVAMLALIALFEGSGYYLDTALVLALLSFVVTLAAALYRGERKIL